MPKMSAAKRALKQLIKAKKPIKDVKKQLEKRLGKKNGLGIESSGHLRRASAEARKALKPTGSVR